MVSSAGVQPSGGITEALAQVVAPLLAIRGNPVPPRDGPLQGLRRPPQLPARAHRKFSPDEVLVRHPRLIAEPHPGEMEDLVNQNAGEFPRAFAEFAVEYDLPLTNEGARMHWDAARLIGIEPLLIGCQARPKMDPDRFAV